jgi:hypothetical protein
MALFSRRGHTTSRTGIVRNQLGEKRSVEETERQVCRQQPLGNEQQKTYYKT